MKIDYFFFFVLSIGIIFGFNFVFDDGRFKKKILWYVGYILLDIFCVFVGYVNKEVRCFNRRDDCCVCEILCCGGVRENWFVWE